jgi:flagellar hook-associated protein FlgK
MNVNRLLEILGYFQDYETKFKVQNQLQELSSHLSNLASNPSNAPFQTAYSDTLQKLEKSLNRLANELEPREVNVLWETGGTDYFSLEISDKK